MKFKNMLYFATRDTIVYQKNVIPPNNILELLINKTILIMLFIFETLFLPVELLISIELK